MSLFSSRNSCFSEESVRQLDSYFRKLKNADDGRSVYVYKAGVSCETIVTLPKKPQSSTDFYELAALIQKNVPDFTATHSANFAEMNKIKNHFVRNLLVDAALAGHPLAKEYLEFSPHCFWDAEKRSSFTIQYPREIKSVYQLSKLRSSLAIHQAQLESLEMIELARGHQPMAQTLTGDLYKVTTTAANLKKLLACLTRKIREAQMIERKQMTEVAYRYAEKMLVMKDLAAPKGEMGITGPEQSSYIQKLLFTQNLAAVDTRPAEHEQLTYEPAFGSAYRR